MCGIAGWYARGGRAVDASAVRAMCATIVHRGPDDEGIHTDGDFGFGMRRLSIVDVAGGHQPMTSENGRFVLTYNGEIYNHPALRAELEALGHRYRTHCDTESILLGFQQWGPGVWERLEGMFAAALWDAHERTLHLARDPLGIKPLYLSLQNGGLAYASELKALVPVPGLRFTPDARAMDQYFAFGHVLAPHTIYAEVTKLEPGCALSIGPAGEPRTTRYW
jgi:asparagine synthase (glutamine-hydrolysing)